jgi:hypothetical protein
MTEALQISLSRVFSRRIPQETIQPISHATRY